MATDPGSLISAIAITWLETIPLGWRTAVNRQRLLANTRESQSHPASEGGLRVVQIDLGHTWTLDKVSQILGTEPPPTDSGVLKLENPRSCGFQLFELHELFMPGYQIGAVSIICPVKFVWWCLCLDLLCAVQTVQYALNK